MLGRKTAGGHIGRQQRERTKPASRGGSDDGEGAGMKMMEEAECDKARGWMREGKCEILKTGGSVFPSG